MQTAEMKVVRPDSDMPSNDIDVMLKRHGVMDRLAKDLTSEKRAILGTFSVVVREGYCRLERQCIFGSIARLPIGQFHGVLKKIAKTEAREYRGHQRLELGGGAR